MKHGSETGEDETTALHRRGSSSTSKPDYLACSADENLPNARVAFIGFNCKLSRWKLFLIIPVSISNGLFLAYPFMHVLKYMYTYVYTYICIHMHTYMCMYANLKHVSSVSSAFQMSYIHVCTYIYICTATPSNVCRCVRPPSNCINTPQSHHPHIS